MSLNKQKGNMYGFVTHTWNPIRGICPHKCSYCYMNGFVHEPLHLALNTANDNLGEKKIIFVGSSTDMFCQDVGVTWINRVLNQISLFPNNYYLFQTKNPLRFFDPDINNFPDNSIFCTTIETNRDNLINRFTNAPDIQSRVTGLSKILNYKRMLTIEPIMDFDIKEMLELIFGIKPNFVNIGADSKQNQLPEPDRNKLIEFIAELKKLENDPTIWENGIKVNLKTNLERIK